MTSPITKKQRLATNLHLRIRAFALKYRFRRIGLRNRILITFGFGALILSVVLATTTYSLTRVNLVAQREESSANQANRSAHLITTDLKTYPDSAQFALSRIGADNPLLFYQGEWTPAIANFGPDLIPESLLKQVIDEKVSAQIITRIGKDNVLIIGIPLADVNAQYFEFVTFDQVGATLESLRLALLSAATITTFVGLMLGLFAAQRAVRPLASAALAARAIADGRLDTRLEPTSDPDLKILTESFNEMAETMQKRVERDAQFASDVSHELRSPLMTLSASVEVMNGRRSELSDRSQAALDLLIADVERFQSLVEDLLEISRFDAGAIRLTRENINLMEFVRQAVAVSSLPETNISCEMDTEKIIIRGDKRRLARVIANLIDNARVHSDGTPSVVVSLADEDAPVGHVWIAVEDNGQGLIESEMQRIFERFTRGAMAGNRGTSEGAGLGLALVNEHIRLHGGRVWAQNRRDGKPGARFVVELSIESQS